MAIANIYHCSCPKKSDINAIPMKITETFKVSGGKQAKVWSCTKCGESVLIGETIDDSKT